MYLSRPGIWRASVEILRAAVLIPSFGKGSRPPAYVNKLPRSYT